MEQFVTNDVPIAYFFTWTVYGVHLPGDRRGWWKRGRGYQEGCLWLEKLHKTELKHSIELLDDDDRGVVFDAVVEICDIRGWHLSAQNPRTNHVHAVVAADPIRPAKLMLEQIKAKCTRALRAKPRFCARPVWAGGGSRQQLFRESDVEEASVYTLEAQDRKYRDEM